MASVLFFSFYFSPQPKFLNRKLSKRSRLVHVFKKPTRTTYFRRMIMTKHVRTATTHTRGLQKITNFYVVSPSYSGMKIYYRIQHVIFSENCREYLRWLSSLPKKLIMNIYSDVLYSLVGFKIASFVLFQSVLNKTKLVSFFDLLHFFLILFVSYQTTTWHYRQNLFLFERLEV